MIKEFELKEAHLVLLRRAFVSWNDGEFGAPEIDCKRPYGNSDVITDIREIFGDTGEECPHCGEVMEKDTDTPDSYYEKLHKETQTALQIVLRCQAVEPGLYRDAGYHDWKKAE